MNRCIHVFYFPFCPIFFLSLRFWILFSLHFIIPPQHLTSRSVSCIESLRETKKKTLDTIWDCVVCAVHISHAIIHSTAFIMFDICYTFCSVLFCSVCVWVLHESGRNSNALVINSYIKITLWLLSIGWWTVIFCPLFLVSNAIKMTIGWRQYWWYKQYWWSTTSHMRIKYYNVNKYHPHPYRFIYENCNFPHFYLFKLYTFFVVYIC